MESVAEFPLVDGGNLSTRHGLSPELVLLRSGELSGGNPR